MFLSTTTSHTFHCVQISVLCAESELTRLYVCFIPETRHLNMWMYVLEKVQRFNVDMTVM